MTHRFRTIRKTPPADRGYGLEHVRARKAAAHRHHPDNPCTRCGEPLGPMGPQLHWDHNRTRTGYLGFAHAHCNMTAGAREGGRRRRAQRRTSRNW